MLEKRLTPNENVNDAQAIDPSLHMFTRSFSPPGNFTYHQLHRVITCYIKPAALKHQLSIVTKRRHQPHLPISAYMHTASRPTTQHSASSPYAPPQHLPESFSSHTIGPPKIPTSSPLCRNPSTGPLQAHGHPERPNQRSKNTNDATRDPGNHTHMHTDLIAEAQGLHVQDRLRDLNLPLSFNASQTKCRAHHGITRRHMEIRVAWIMEVGRIASTCVGLTWEARSARGVESGEVCA
jgi:hypothetical protein